ncbi:Tat pathway signal sequence domain protein [Streptomyces sp. NPDC004647]|uniref:Tat pathway signal sequence domain protein n=1 Tax=Streptomyces sp. NPDC004647 TaxID=3154671 RepID=UPI0033B5896F
MMRRHLGKVVAGAAIAVTSTAVMVAVTLPGDAGAADGRTEGRGGSAAQSSDEGQEQGQGRAQQQPGVVESSVPVGARGTGRDALTDDELRRAEQLALNPGLRSAGEDVEGEAGPQWLSTDLAELQPSETGAADPPRRAELSYYDYKADTFLTKTVNLTTGKVEKTDTLRGEQPPPTRPEAAEAVKILLDSPLSSGLKKDYRDATGKALTGADQLETTGMVYRIDEENSGPAELRECGKHRCVRLFTKVRNGPWIDSRQLIVDLSDRTVGRI